MLSNCNSLSATRLERALRDFRQHTQHINGLKKELDQVFKRIRTIKSKVAQQYPDAYRGKLSSNNWIFLSLHKLVIYIPFKCLGRDL